MPRRRVNPMTAGSARDDIYNTVIRKSFAGGVNTRQFNAVIGEEQVAEALNVDLSIPGEAQKVPGITPIVSVDTSTTFVDNETTPKTVTANGDAQVDTAQYKFGGAACLLDGTGDYLSSADHADWQLGGGTGDFTVELFVRFQTSLASNRAFVGQRVDADNRWGFYWVQSTSLLTFIVRSSASDIITVTGSWSPVIDTWYHIAVTRTSNSFQLWVNGVQVGSTVTDTDTVPNLAAELRIGEYNSDTMTGWVDEIRISSSSRYSSNFTVPTSPFVADANTKLLLHCDGSIAGTGAITGLFGFDPAGGTAELLITEATNLRGWTGGGSVSSAYKSDFTTSLDTTMFRARESGEGDVVLVGNGTDNWFRMLQDHTFQDLGNTNTSPPRSTVGTMHIDNRVWILSSNLLYFSTSFPADFSAAFDRTTNAFKISVGAERAVVSTRNFGLIIFGKEQIWVLNPSLTPAPTTDKPEPLFTDLGCASGRTVAEVGDDYFWLSFDGVRSIKRTQQDKLQLGVSYPLSYSMKDEFDLINWNAITKACAVYFDNKYIISLPTSGSSTNNRVWVYYPASDGWSVVTGWNVSVWAKFKVSGQVRLFAGEATAQGLVYRAWSGANANGTPTTFRITTRSEDMGNPLVKKVGGEVKVKAKATGDYDVTIKASFDDGGFNTLGTFNLTGTGITFPVTFPVSFGLAREAFKKFHLDGYGEWYRCQLQFENSDSLDSEADMSFREYSLATHPVEYISEEEA